MKKLVSLLILCLYSLVAHSQGQNIGFPSFQTAPVSISGTVTINSTPISLVQLAKEGRVLTVGSSSISTVVGSPLSATIQYGTALLGGSALQLQPGRAFFVTSANASASAGPLELSGGLFAVKPFGAFLPQQSAAFSFIIPSVGGMVSISPNMLLGSEGQASLNAKWLGANNSPLPYVHSSFTGIEFTADFNFTAKKAMLMVGESTFWYVMGNDPDGVAYPADSLIGFHIVNALNAERKSTRHINKAFGGANSMHINYAQRSGYLDVDYDLLIYNAQHNDKAANTTQAKYQSNLRAIIDHRNQHRPGASILFVSDFPQDVISDARNVNYRAWMQEVATSTAFGGGTANKVYYVDCSAAFALGATASADLNFTERVAGQRLHPSGLGHGLIFRSKIWPAIKLTDFYLNTKW